MNLLRYNNLTIIAKDWNLIRQISGPKDYSKLYSCELEMIEKTNLLPKDDSEYDVQILPNIPGLRLLFEIDISILPEKEIQVNWGNAVQEILYCYNGYGIVQLASVDVTIQRGDRIIIEQSQDYVIRNVGYTNINVSRKGVIISM